MSTMSFQISGLLSTDYNFYEVVTQTKCCWYLEKWLLGSDQIESG